jgi:hypothetical protein
MESEVNIDSYNIPYGEYPTISSIDIFKNERLSAFRKSGIKKKSGLKNNNYFAPTTDAENKLLMDELNTLLGHRFDWAFEFCHSGEPANLHTDYATVPWDDTTECQVVVGCIIPLSWCCEKPPYTVMYDKVSDIPRKLMFYNGEMIYQDNKEIYSYQQEFPMWDDRIMFHHPKGTEYFRTFGDLRWHSEYEWDRSTMLVFDTKRWHSSNWWAKSTTVKDIKSFIMKSSHCGAEYKESLVGFGSIDVPRNLT